MYPNLVGVARVRVESPQARQYFFFGWLNHVYKSTMCECLNPFHVFFSTWAWFPMPQTAFVIAKKHAFMAMYGYLHFQTNIRGMEFERDTRWYLLVMYFGWNPPKT